MFDIELKQELNSIKLQYNSTLYKVDGFDYQLNPFAFIKDSNKISLINLRDFQTVEIIDSFIGNQNNDWIKNHNLLNFKIENVAEGQIYELIDVQDKSEQMKNQNKTEIRKISIKIP
ncbi:UNKNOWN [Stylonychia lemnae]|uniref:Uncharacterized protein n=1 Tax=Stylonychia lemnae TaxID=5949 RepID=A0A077ZZ87_STYLE|nr:UNKNOWN [Stylonychia lemnae]|eukprot:CDW74533.1 UNKNOWN [Stylonychia lemnae]